MFGWRQNKGWRSSPAHLLLLSKFRNGDSPMRYRDADYWETVLGEKPANVIEQFTMEGMLERAGLPELIAYKFKTSDLKSRLRDNGLKVSGRKEELVQRLIDNDAKAMSEATKDIKLYRCTATGMQLAENYLASEKTKRESAERDAFELLARDECSKAARVVAQYEASQVFPRGLGINWKSYDETSDVESLRTMFDSTPAILRSIEEIRLKPLRLGAGMMQLWGTNRARDWLPDGFDTGIHLDADAACRMFVFYASHLRRMKDYRKAGVRTVKVLGVDDGNTCSECRKISGKKFHLENMLELPYAKCTCEIGCRCTTVVEEFRWQT
jgi:hypothetical protein